MLVIKIQDQPNLGKIVAGELFNIDTCTRYFVDGVLQPKDKWAPYLREYENDGFICARYTSPRSYCCSKRVALEVDIAYKKHKQNVENLLKTQVGFKTYTTDEFCLTYTVSNLTPDWTQLVRCVPGMEVDVFIDIHDILTVEKTMFVESLTADMYRNQSKLAGCIRYYGNGQDINMFQASFYKHNRAGRSKTYQSEIGNLQFTAIPGPSGVEHSCTLCDSLIIQTGYVLYGIIGLPASISCSIRDLHEGGVQNFSAPMVCRNCYETNYRNILDLCHYVFKFPTKYTFEERLKLMNPIEQALILEFADKSAEILKQTAMVDFGNKKYMLVKDNQYLVLAPDNCEFILCIDT